MRPIDTDRRRMVKLTGAAVVGTALAGCSADGGGDGDGEYDGWLSDANGYDETVDVTGEDEVTVEVGAGSGLAFDPAAIRVDAGTTVVWEWVGGMHDVVDTDGAFESELQSGSGETFSHTFEETGVYTYECTPHANQGMKGAVDVV